MMCIYNLSAEQIEKKFEDFLRSQEGDVSAEIIVEAWNNLSKKHGWGDRLKAI